MVSAGASSGAKLPGDAEGAGFTEQLGKLIAEKTGAEVEVNLRIALSGILRSVVDVGVALREGKAEWSSDQIGSQNTFGDNQLAVDVTSDKAVFARLKQSGVIATAASEETTVETKLIDDGSAPSGDVYSVGFDPLDGSSIVDANFTVGSIFGVWPGDRLLNRTGKEQHAAAMAMYGPRITVALAVLSKASGKTHALELTLKGEGEQANWVVTREELKLAPEGKVFAPGNLRAVNDNPVYKKLVDSWIDGGYTLRYTGGMVPDVYHMFIKGKGVFANVSSGKAKAKLRLLYECAPIAFIVEAAGGRSSVDPAFLEEGKKNVPISVLEVVIDDLDKRIGICYGGVTEVDKFEQMLVIGA